jgi:hypothetical protein
MTKHTMSSCILIAFLIFLTAFKKSTAPVKVSIANATAIQSEKGQRPVKVLVYLSQPVTERVTVKYSTENGSAKAGVDYVAAKGSLVFEPGEVAKWISIDIIGEVAADPDEDAPLINPPDFIVMISEATGVIIDVAKAYITILQRIARNPSLIGASGNESIYEVMISYTGYTSFAGTAADCGIRPDGEVVLSGYLSGSENINSDDDIMYRGNLEMIIDIDICSIVRLPGSDEDKLCGIRVNGSGKVYTELEIYFADDNHKQDSRGGYIQIENKDGKFKRTVTGQCIDQNDDEWTMIPNKSISSVFNGNELPMLKTRTLRKGVYKTTDKDGNVTIVEVLRKIQ